MADGSGCEILSDAVWAVWEPLIEEVRPRGKTPPKELRRTIAAIFWRHQNGAKWRRIPAALGPWWLAAQLFIRWAKQGVWERLLDLVQQHDIAFGMTFLDGTNIRAHHKAAGAEKGGSTAKSEMYARRLAARAAAMAQSLCHRRRARAIAFAPGQAPELPLAPGLLGCRPDVPGWIVGDRGCASDAVRERI
jgi:transposase